MNLQKFLPVATSIVIILIVAVLREKSRTLAAIFGTMPINMPLAMWLVYSSSDQNTATITPFTGSLITGLLTSVVWLLVVYVSLRLGFGLLTAILSGYIVWGILIAFAFWFGLLSISRIQ